MSKWLNFVPGLPKPKTDTWLVTTKEGSRVLGEIKWFSQWRKYGFFPYVGSLFEEDCLNDIAAFIKEKTAEHKEKRCL